MIKIDENNINNGYKIYEKLLKESENIGYKADCVMLVYSFIANNQGCKNSTLSAANLDDLVDIDDCLDYLNELGLLHICDGKIYVCTNV